MNQAENLAKKRARLRSIAESVLLGETDPIDGCLALYEAGAPEFPELKEIIAIHSELDHIPRGDGEKLASEDLKRRIDSEKAEASKFYGRSILELCRKIADRR